MKTTRALVLDSLDTLEKWIVTNNYKGYDPFDGLSSFLRPLTFGNLLLDRVLMQTIRQCPINLRPLLGVTPLESTIGRGYMAWGYLAMLRATGNKQYYDKAVGCLKWLEKNRAPGFKSYCWGKHFNYASRGGRYAKLEPITVWTSIIGLVFVDAYELLLENKYLEIAVSICDWILGVPRTNTDKGTCIGYTTTEKGDCTIHNQSMLAAAMLAKTARYSENNDYLDLAKSAMAFSCNSQLPAGGWYYGENHNSHWIDNFHSGYNLDALKCYIEYSNDEAYRSNLQKGFEFYKANFFDEDGRPKYYHNRTYPIDIQCAAQAIETLAKFSDHDKSYLNLALKVADWTIKNMQDKRGNFYYRQYPIIKAKTPMIHWGQATMFRALSVLFQKVQEKDQASLRISRARLRP